MRQLTVTIPDDFYSKLMSFLEPFPEVEVKEKDDNEVPLWQQELVLNRIKNSKPEDYIDAKEALNNLRNKYEI